MSGKQFSVGIGAMVKAIDIQIAFNRKMSKKPGVIKHEVDYLCGVLENTRETLQWIRDHQAPIVRAAKQNVPFKVE